MIAEPSPMVASPAGKSRGRHRSTKSVSSMGPLATNTQPFSTPKYSYQNPPRLYNGNNGPQTQQQSVTPPQTPKIHQSNGNTSATSAKKNKRKQKPRPRDVSTGFVPHQEPQSPPSSSSDDVFAGPPSPSRGPHTPTKAYAGPNWHSSPAPSSLPVPSFFSKSVPATPHTVPSLQAMFEMQEDVHSASSSGSSSGSDSESHLERLFRADKEEKERKIHRGLDSSPQTPPGQKSVDSYETSLFTMDLDKKEQAKETTNTLPPSNSQASSDQWKAKSDALRTFLQQHAPTHASTFSNHVKVAPTSPQQYSSLDYQPQYFHATPTKSAFGPPLSPPQTRFAAPQQPRFMTTPPRGPSRARPNYGMVNQSPTPPQRHCNFNSGPKNLGLDREAGTGDLQMMEDYLRRILKLEGNSMAASAAAAS